MTFDGSSGFDSCPLVQQFKGKLELVDERQPAHRMRNFGLRAHDLSHVCEEVPPAPSVSSRSGPDHA